jgi:Domain of unknown function (DUF4386)
MFIAIGIVCMLAVSSLRQDAAGGTDAAVGQGIFAVYEWTFRIGPGVFAGIANGLILGWLMYRSGLVPPRFALLGLVGGPLVSTVGVLVILGVLPAEGPHQVLVAPEFIWELDRHLSHRQGLPDLVAGPEGPGRPVRTGITPSSSGWIDGARCRRSSPKGRRAGTYPLPTSATRSLPGTAFRLPKR